MGNPWVIFCLPIPIPTKTHTHVPMGHHGYGFKHWVMGLKPMVGYPGVILGFISSYEDISYKQQRWTVYVLAVFFLVWCKKWQKCTYHHHYHYYYCPLTAWLCKGGITCILCRWWTTTFLLQLYKHQHSNKWHHASAFSFSTCSLKRHPPLLIPRLQTQLIIYSRAFCWIVSR